VLVAYAGRTTLQAALHAKNRIEGVGGRIFGAILNNVDLDSEDYGNYYRYYYQHTDYGEEKPRGRRKS